MRGKKVQAFINALEKLEQFGDLEPMAQLFSENSELSNLGITSPVHGKAGAYRFWKGYAKTFKSVKSTFNRISENGSIAVLEWTSEGILPQGTPFHYSGVTLLDFEGDQIVRFKAYYDSALLMEHSARHAA
jgi:limonene-1,2-epoxide hydrolase